MAPVASTNGVSSLGDGGGEHLKHRHQLQVTKWNLQLARRMGFLTKKTLKTSLTTTRREDC